MDKLSRFIGNHHTMNERYVPERRARLQEEMSTPVNAADTPAKLKDKPKKRVLLRLIEAITGRSSAVD
jgi:hypothetical protein